MTNDKNNLIEDNINLAYKVAWDYNSKLKGFVELEELQSLCFLGLVKSAQTFDKTKNIEFSTYSYTVMKNEIIHFLNKNKKSSNDISLSHPLTEDLYLEDTLSSDFNLEDRVEKDIKIQNLYKFISELDELDNSILLKSLKGLTSKQIAANLGLSEEYINERYRKAVNKLRYKFYRYQGGEL